MQLTSADQKEENPVGRTVYRRANADALNLHLTRDRYVINFIYFLKAELSFQLEFALCLRFQ
jgi:hypothetical protein